MVLTALHIIVFCVVTFFAPLIVFADFNGANLTDIDLRGSKLENANFTDAKGLTEELIKELKKRGAILE